MNLLSESAVTEVTGGAKSETGESPRPSLPVPIWRPVFTTDP